MQSVRGGGSGLWEEAQTYPAAPPRDTVDWAAGWTDWPGAHVPTAGRPARGGSWSTRSWAAHLMKARG